MKTIKSTLATLVLLFASSIVSASTLSGNINLVGLGLSTIDSSAQTINFNPNIFFVVAGTSDLSVMSGNIGTVKNVGGALPLVSFLTSTNAAGDIFNFDMTSASFTSDNKRASGQGIASLTVFATGVTTSSIAGWEVSNQGTNTTWSATVPEPATLAIFGLGLIGLGFARSKKA